MHQREQAPMDRPRIVGIVALLPGVAFVAGEALSRARPDTDFVACATEAAYLVNLVGLL